MRSFGTVIDVNIPKAHSITTNNDDHQAAQLWLSVWEAKSEKKEMERFISKWENALSLTKKYHDGRTRAPLVQRLSTLLDVVASSSNSHHQQQEQHHQQHHQQQQQEQRQRQRRPQPAQEIHEIRNEIQDMFSQATQQHHHQHQHQSTNYQPKKLSLTTFAKSTPRLLDGQEMGSTLVARPGERRRS